MMIIIIFFIYCFNLTNILQYFNLTNILPWQPRMTNRKQTLIPIPLRRQYPSIVIILKFENVRVAPQPTPTQILMCQVDHHYIVELFNWYFCHLTLFIGQFYVRASDPNLFTSYLTSLMARMSRFESYKINVIFFVI